MLGNSDDGGSCLVTAMMVVMVAVYGWLRQTSLPGGIWHPADLLLLGSVNPGSDFGLGLQSLPYLHTGIFRSFQKPELDPCMCTRHMRRADEFYKVHFCAVRERVRQPPLPFTSLPNFQPTEQLPKQLPKY